MPKPVLPDNCPISEHTADNVPVGRCMHYMKVQDGKYVCPRHGDVTKARERYVTEGKLTDDRALDRK